MKKKAVFSIAIMLIATSLVSAKNNSPLALEFTIDQEVKQEITSLVEGELQQAVAQQGEDKNWLKNEPLDYLLNKQDYFSSILDLVESLKNGSINVKDIEPRKLFDTISYTMVRDKAMFVKLTDKKMWSNSDSPLSYVAELEPKRTLLTQAVLANDKGALKQVFDNIPRLDKEEVLAVTLESLMKLPNPAESLLDENSLRQEIDRLDKLVSTGAKYRELKNTDESQQVTPLIESDWDKLQRYRAELNKIENEKTKYGLLKKDHPTYVHLAHYVMDGDLRGLTVAYGFLSYSEKIDESYKALGYLIDIKPKNKPKKI